jgi:phosphoglycerate dehydrogenase-like enzyme
VGTPPLIALAPDRSLEYAREAVVEAGGRLVGVDEAEALVWTSPFGPDALAATIADARAAGAPLRWVHLRFAGVEDFARQGLFTDELLWTCGKGVFAEPVAEHALALMLAGLRDLPVRLRARSWGTQSGVSLYDGNVTILGGGGITERLIELLTPMRTNVTVVRRSGRPVEGAARVVTQDKLLEALNGADAVVVALALTAETEGIINARALSHMQPHAWLVNVGRGKHVVTDDLVRAVQGESIGGAALDVTEPEPLPDGHPLWDLPNVIITPHTANTFEMALPAMRERLAENVRRFARGEPLIGTVDPALGY